MWKVLFLKAQQIASIKPWRAVSARGSTAAQQIGYLSRFINFKISVLFFIQSVDMCLSFLFSQPLPPTDLMPLLPHWSVSSLSLSFSLIDHHCWWVSHLYHFLTISLFIHIHFSRLPISFLHVVTLELLFCVSIQIKYEWGLRFFFP